MNAKIIYLFLLPLLVACSKDNRWACFTPYGAEVSEVRGTEGFTRVNAYNKISVTILQGNNCRVEVIAGKNVIHNIKTKVEGDILYIEDNNTCNFVRGYKHTVKVNVTMPYIAKATNNGVGPMTFDAGFTQDSLSVRAESSGDIYINGNYKKIQTSSHGNGDIYISGSCEELFVYCYGTNFLEATGLEIKNYGFIANQSLGDCNINAAQTPLIQYVISNSGNINYKGVPAKIEGAIYPGVKGKVNKLD